MHDRVRGECTTLAGGQDERELSGAMIDGCVAQGGEVVEQHRDLGVDLAVGCPDHGPALFVLVLGDYETVAALDQLLEECVTEIFIGDVLEASSLDCFVWRMIDAVTVTSFRPFFPLESQRGAKFIPH